MQRSVWVVVFLVILGIGFAAGFYLSNYLQNQIQVLIGAAIVLAVLTWIGSGTDILGLLRDWFREKREEERIPVLAFAGFTKTDDWINLAEEGEYISYFVIVKKTKGEGFAKDCEGFLTVEGTAISNAPTVWAHADARHYDIGGRMDLRLFTVRNKAKEILFPSAHLNEGFVPTAKPYNDFINKELKIEIHSDKGRPPQDLIVRIQDIITAAKEEGAGS